MPSLHRPVCGSRCPAPVLSSSGPLVAQPDSSQTAARTLITTFTNGSLRQVCTLCVAHRQRAKYRPYYRIAAPKERPFYLASRQRKMSSECCLDATARRLESRLTRCPGRSHTAHRFYSSAAGSLVWSVTSVTHCRRSAFFS